MKKLKTLHYWYIVLFLIMLMLAFGYFFELGESLGKALAMQYKT